MVLILNIRTPIIVISKGVMVLHGGRKEKEKKQKASPQVGRSSRTCTSIRDVLGLGAWQGCRVDWPVVGGLAIVGTANTMARGLRPRLEGRRACRGDLRGGG